MMIFVKREAGKPNCIPGGMMLCWHQQGTLGKGSKICTTIVAVAMI